MNLLRLLNQNCQKQHYSCCCPAHIQEELELVLWLQLRVEEELSARVLQAKPELKPVLP